MADIELVVKIPEELKEALDNAKKENAFNYMRVYNDTIYNAFKNGTPLPKGHGKIGDLDALRDEVSSWGMNDYEPLDFIDAIDDADTILEADKESEG